MRGRECSRQFSVWLHGPIAARKVIKCVDTGRQGKIFDGVVVFFFLALPFMLLMC